MGKEDIVIECIAEESFNNFCEIVDATSILRQDKQIVIFGAGIMGMQFAYTLQQLGINNFIFCDNDSQKWGVRLVGTTINNPMLLQNGDNYFVYLAMENYEECATQLEEMGFEMGIDWVNLTNCSERKLLDSFEKNDDAHVLILGDCTVSTVSVQEKYKVSIGEILRKTGDTKVLALNGLYMRSYYNILRLCKYRMKYFQEVYVLLNVDIMGNRYFLYPKNQHGRVMKELYKKSKKTDDKEMQDFLQVIEEREKGTSILDLSSPNRYKHLSEKEVENQRRVHMKLNFLYHISENTESMEYLHHILDFCRNVGIKITFVIMAINYERGEEYFGDEFRTRYGEIITVLQRHIINGKGSILDLSYLLPQGDFICLRSTNEGILEHGRKLIAEKFVERMKKGCQSEWSGH